MVPALAQTLSCSSSSGPEITSSQGCARSYPFLYGTCAISDVATHRHTDADKGALHFECGTIA